MVACGHLGAGAEDKSLSRQLDEVALGVSTRSHAQVEAGIGSGVVVSNLRDFAVAPRCQAEGIRWQSWETLRKLMMQSANPRLLPAAGHKARWGPGWRGE